MTVAPTEQRLTTEPSAVRVARAIVRDALQGVLPADDLDAAVLATSELVTNAVEHGAGPVDLRVLCADRCARIEVADTSPLRPRLRTEAPGPNEVRGRGMLIVDTSSDRMGITEAAEGKTVWFEIDL